MAKEKTNKVKKEVMTRICEIIPHANLIDRKTIKAPNYTIAVWASKDYDTEPADAANWYGIFSSEIDKVKNSERTAFLFTTGDTKNFLLIPFNEFNKLMPHLRATKEGFFFLVHRQNDRWFIPLSYIQKDKRHEVSENGISLDKYVNNLSFIGSDYTEYSKDFEEKKTTVAPEPDDTIQMIRDIADKDPLFFTKSNEEKLIIIRYNQIKNK